jgi:hypothetical protein
VSIVDRNRKIVFMNQRIILFVLVALLLTLLPVVPLRAQARCFPDHPEIAYCVDERFSSFWQQQGGLPVFGYPLGNAYEEQTEDGTIVVQLFERVQLEWHPDNAPPFNILLSHLGRELGPEPASPQPPRDGCLFFAQTGQNICEPFLSTWRRYGLELGTPGISEGESVALFGLPLTPARPETLGDGQTYTVQWFERARFEDHGADGVLLGLLGSELAGVGGGTTVGTWSPAPREEVSTDWQNPYGPQEPGGFIEVAGAQLTRLGQPVRLKGVNYYPQWHPWGEMWTKWHAPQMEEELRLARDHLGINAVRILLPYGAYGDGKVTSQLVQRLREMCQIAGDLDMRLIVTLFDFYNTFPEAGSNTERDNIEYLQTLLGNFTGDDRIFAWDLHNEPDHYEKWTQGDEDKVLDWLGRMADVVHEIAPHHLVTVGMANYQNLWRPGPDGRRVIDYSDVVSVHIYNAADAARQLDEIRARTDKPLLLQEFGWPSGPPCAKEDYTEAHQAWVYQETLQAADGRVAGVFAWTLRDYDASITMRWDSREEHYGLYRADGTLKPAAISLRAFDAPPLPSHTRTDMPLTTGRSFKVKGDKAPMLIEGSGHYVKSWYRRVWESFGGQGSLGLPLSEAFIRPEDGKVVQYFAAAVLEYDDDAFEDRHFHDLPRGEQMVRTIRPFPLGYDFTAGRTFPPPAHTPLPNARYFPETGYNVQGDFWSLYENLLGPWRFGAAISGEVMEQVGGQTVPVQYFAYGRIERDPATGLVQPGQLGRWAWERRCRSMGQ